MSYNTCDHPAAEPIGRRLKGERIAVLRGSLEANTGTTLVEHTLDRSKWFVNLQGSADMGQGLTRKLLSRGPCDSLSSVVSTSNMGDSRAYLRDEPDLSGEFRQMLRVMTREPVTVLRRSSGRFDFTEWISGKEDARTS